MIFQNSKNGATFSFILEERPLTVTARCAAESSQVAIITTLSYDHITLRQQDQAVRLKSFMISSKAAQRTGDQATCRPPMGVDKFASWLEPHSPAAISGRASMTLGADLEH